MRDGTSDDGIGRVSAAVATVANVSRSAIPSVDFADMWSVLSDHGGRAVFGEGEASGAGRTARAAEAALADLSDQLRRIRDGA
jgi:cell division GTPase FtsZ